MAWASYFSPARLSKHTVCPLADAATENQPQRSNWEKWDFNEDSYYWSVFFEFVQESCFANCHPHRKIKAEIVEITIMSAG